MRRWLAIRARYLGYVFNAYVAELTIFAYIYLIALIDVSIGIAALLVLGLLPASWDPLFAKWWWILTIPLGLFLVANLLVTFITNSTLFRLIFRRGVYFDTRRFRQDHD